MHWQNVLFNSRCDIVGVIDWEWSHTVPLESATVIPFNLAEYAGRTWSDPKNESRIQKYENMAIEDFREKAPECAVARTLETPQRRIVGCLDNYNWALTREAHAQELKQLLASVLASAPQQRCRDLPPPTFTLDDESQAGPSRENGLEQNHSVVTSVD